MKRLGVIVGFTGNVSPQEASVLLPILEARYPGVVFTLIDNAAGHLAFDFDGPCMHPEWGYGYIDGDPHRKVERCELCGEQR